MSADPTAPRPLELERKPTSSRLVLLALVTSVCAAGAFTLVYRNALDPSIASAQAEATATQALHNIGYTWAQVRVEGSVAHIVGEAPGEPERVIAYEIVYKTLRPLMTETHRITEIASGLTLTPQALTTAALREPHTPRSEPDPEPAVGAGQDAPVVTQAETKPETPPAAVTQAIVEPAPSQSSTPQSSAPPSSASQSTASQSPQGPAAAGATATAAMEPTAALSTPAAEPARITIETPRQPDRAPRIEVAAATPQPASAEAAPRAVTAAAAPQQPAAIPSSTDCRDELKAALVMAKIAFASDSAAIARESRPLLDKLAGIASRCKKFHLIVEGHTDGSGGKIHNLELSKKRAEAVRWALVDRGVDMDHISAEGFGSSRPIVQGTSDRANAENRRIEFNVLEKATPAQRAAASKN